MEIISKPKKKRDPRWFTKIPRIYEDMEFAILCNESLEDVISLAERNKLSALFKIRKVYGRWIFTMSDSTELFIHNVRRRGVSQLFRLLEDAKANRFTWRMKRDINDLDFSSYY